MIFRRWSRCCGELFELESVEMCAPYVADEVQQGSSGCLDGLHGSDIAEVLHPSGGQGLVLVAELTCEVGDAVFGQDHPISFGEALLVDGT